jgi:rare lipoprotein A
MPGSMRHIARTAAMLGMLLLGGCSFVPSLPLPGGTDSAPSRPPDVSTVPDAVPRKEPRSKYGNPPSYVVHGKRYYVLQSGAGYVERGIASWYGTKFHGRRTSSGEPYDMYAMTAAHKTLPLPTYARITNLENGRSVVVRINDRGPFHDGRIVDLSYTAAYKLGMLAKGTAPVELRVLDPSAPRQMAATTTPRTPARIFLQVGAFSSRYNAERLQGKLLELALSEVSVTPVENAGRTIYRVRLGPVADVNKADELAATLARLGYDSARIVVD